MSFFEALEKETLTNKQYLMGSPIIARALAGKLSLNAYILYLEQAYHHVKHTVPLMMAAGHKIGESNDSLQKALVEYIEEEVGHQQWILNDIDVCGGNSQQIKSNRPNIETELMVSYAYDFINRINPVGFFGMVYVLEGTSTAVASQAAESIKASLGLPSNAFSYLSSHGALDIEHMKFFENLMSTIEHPVDQSDIIHMAKNMFILFGNVLRSIPLSE